MSKEITILDNGFTEKCIKEMEEVLLGKEKPKNPYRSAYKKFVEENKYKLDLIDIKW